jgi:hypothetical protein
MSRHVQNDTLFNHILDLKNSVSWDFSLNVVLGSPILVTLFIDALNSSEMSFLTRATRRNNSEEAILLNVFVYKIRFGTSWAKV